MCFIKKLECFTRPSLQDGQMPPSNGVSTNTRHRYNGGTHAVVLSKETTFATEVRSVAFAKYSTDKVKKVTHIIFLSIVKITLRSKSKEGCQRI